jgi:hypothetical protein
MRLLYVTLTVTVLGTLSSAPAAQLCQCIGGYTTPGGVHCTAWDCMEAPKSAPPKEVGRSKDCPSYRALLCDGPSCKLVCGEKPAKKK